MMRIHAGIHINFVKPGWRALLLATPAWAVLCAIVGAVLIGVSVSAANQIADQRQQVQLATERAASHSQIVAPAVPLVPEAQAVAINAAIAQLNLPWSDLFDAIEQATPTNIALVGLEPDARRQLLKGEAEALNSDDMIAYIERLKKTPQFVSVVLTKHVVDEQDPFKPYRFSFEAQWRERSP